MRIYSFFLVIILNLGVLAWSQTTNEQFNQLFHEYINSRSEGDYKNALDIIQETLTLDDLSSFEIALAQNNIGLTNWNMGDYSSAKKHYILALNQTEDESKKAIRLRVDLYNNLAILNKQVGDYELSLEYYQSALEALSRYPSRDSKYFEKLSRIQLNQGLVLLKVMRFEEAVKQLKHSLAIKKKYNLAFQGSVHFNLARCYSSLDQHSQAEYHYQASINQWTNEYNALYHRLSGVYLEYGLFLARNGQDSSGIVYFNKEIQTIKVNYGFQHVYAASAFNLIADYYIGKQKYDSAFSYIQKALSSVCPGFRDPDIFSNPYEMEASLNLRLLKIYQSKINALQLYSKSLTTSEIVNQQDHEKAIKLLNLAILTNIEAVDILNRIQSNYLTQESRLFLAEKHIQVFSAGVESSSKLYSLTENPEYHKLAYWFSSTSKALELRLESKRKRQLYLQSQSDSTAHRLIKIRNELDSYTNLIQMEWHKPSPDSLKIVIWQDQQFELRRTYDELFSSLLDHSHSKESEWSLKGLDHLNYEKQISDFIIQLQSKLGRKESLVEFFLSDNKDVGEIKLHSFILNNDGLNMVTSVLDPTFHNNINIIDSLLIRHNRTRLARESRIFLDQTFHELYKELIEPIESHLTGNQITIIPTQYLIKIPFGALITSGYSNNHSQQSSYLIEKFQLKYISSAELLTHRTYPAWLKIPHIKAIMMNQSVDDSNYAQLPNVGSEIDIILEIFPGKKLLFGPKDYLLSDLPESEILHFAMHASPADSSHESSYLVLSAQLDSTYNHLLFDYEIETLNLNCALAVLNTCGSGAGIYEEGEGIFSLSRSFVIGGAEAVTHTQWPVDDQISSEIITKYYKGLAKGWRKSRALQVAQTEYLENASPVFLHPYYWAGYQHVGDDSPVVTAPLIRWILMAFVIFAAFGASWIIVTRIRKRKNVKNTTSNH